MSLMSEYIASGAATSTTLSSGVFRGKSILLMQFQENYAETREAPAPRM